MLRIILAVMILAMLVAGVAFMFMFELHSWQFRHVIEAAASQYRVPAHLIAAVIWRETRFQPIRVGRAGEIGLMQVMPATAKDWAKAEHRASFNRTDLFDPQTNVLAGAWCLRRALDRWHERPDPVLYALTEYNAGRSNVIRWEIMAVAAGIPMTDAISYPTTQRYVNDVALHYRTFGRPWERIRGLRRQAPSLPREP